MQVASNELAPVAAGAVQTPSGDRSGSTRAKLRASFLGGPRLRLSHKFLLIAALSNLPVLLLGYYFIVIGVNDLRSISKEREGIAYLQAIWPTYAAVVAAPAGSEPISRLPAGVVEKFDSDLGTSSLRSDFEAEITGGTEAAVGAGQDFIHQIADNSGLSNDADVSTLAAVGIITTTLPEVAAAAHDLLGLVADKQLADVVGPLGRFEQARRSLAAGLSGADSLNFDASIGATLSGLQIRLGKAELDLASAAMKTVAGQSADLDRSARIIAAHHEYQAALSAFWRSAAGALDVLLARRSAYLRTHLLQELAIGIGLFLIVSGLVWLLARSLTRRLARLRETMETMRQGRLEVEVPERDGNDELGEMGRAVDIFRRGLIDKRQADEALEREHGILLERENALQVQNMRFEAAIENMAQGLCMFDREQRLVVSNKLFAGLYDLPADVIRPGTGLADLIVAGGSRRSPGLQCEADYCDQRYVPEGATGGLELFELANGRTISVVHRSMSDGGWVSTHQDITDQRRNEARIRHLAGHDPLTDLPNRILLHEHLESAEARIRLGDQIAVLCVDLDHFKTINDVRGHSIGDEVLRTVAQRLRECSSATDVVARLGGDEFVVIQGAIKSPEDAAQLAGSIVKAIARPFDVGGDQGLLLGASIGIAVAPIDGVGADDLMKRADLALYRAKSGGKGTFHFYEPGLDAALQERRNIEARLRLALSRHELRLVFQPLVNLDENRIVCLEALLRWDDPERGAVPPSQFIPIAEDSGLIVPIGSWVLLEACTTAARWPMDVRVAINLSAVQFRNRDLVEQVRSALASSGLGPDRLELEITESVLLKQDDNNLETLHRLKRLGVSIVLDDFGTGYSSLTYLHMFPFDKIKIDKSFLHDSASNVESVEIIKAVIGLGHSLGMATTVEGVETESQLNLVRAQGCSEVQGFLFSAPLPATSVAALLAARGQAAETVFPWRAAS